MLLPVFWRFGWIWSVVFLGFDCMEGGWLVGGYVYLVFIDPSSSKLSEDRICGETNT